MKRRQPVLPPIAFLLALVLSFQAGAAAAQTPSAWDWRDVDGTNFLLPVRNIGPCSSSYIAIPVAMVDSRRLVACHNLGLSVRPIQYSVQYLLSCATGYFGDFGCSGGYPKDTLTWIRDVGIAVESCYEYVAVDEDCPTICPDNGLALNLQRIVDEAYEDTGFLDVPALQEMIYRDGPVAVTMDLYADFYSYDQGIYQHLTGNYDCGFITLVVGWGTEGGTDYWICQNCWGTNWGEDGYFRIARNAMHAYCDFGERTLWCSLDVWASPVPEAAAEAAMLSPNFPNPFNPSTTIRYRPPRDGTAALSIHDGAGRLVRMLADRPHAGGREYAVIWDGRDDRGRAVTSGVYFYRLRCNGESATGRMVLLR